MPVASLLKQALSAGDLDTGLRFAWRFANVADVWSRFGPQLWRSAWFGLVATAICLLIGFPLAAAIVRSRRRNLLLACVLGPFFVSFLIRTLAWRFLLADFGVVLGPLKRLGVLPERAHVLATACAVIFGLAYNALPFMVLPIYAALHRLDPRLVDAAADLGASPWRRFMDVTWPLARPGVVAGCVLTFVPAAGDFVNAALLGGTRTTMAGNVIVRLFLVHADLPHAAAMSLLFMAAMGIGLIAYLRTGRLE